MELLDFVPLVDIPLVALTAFAFILNFNRWATNQTDEITVDLAPRLPRARLRIFMLFASLLTFCWLVNVAAWVLFCFLIAIGLFVSIFIGGDLSGPSPIFLIVASLLREWAFGFPQLILEPPTDEVKVKSFYSQQDECNGLRGKALSPLRPAGEVKIDGKVMSCVSENGQQIDAGTDIVVAGKRNGRLYVRKADGED